MEECLKNIKRDPGVNITEVINVANVKADLLDIQKSYSSLNERYGLEMVISSFSHNGNIHHIYIFCTLFY